MESKKFLGLIGTGLFSLGFLAGCGNNEKPSTTSTTDPSVEDVKYEVIVPTSADWTISGLTSDRLYLAGAQVGFSVQLTDPTDKAIKEVKADQQVLQEQDGGEFDYVFTMPTHNVSLSVSTVDLDKFTLSYTGSCLVDEVLTFDLKNRGSSVAADFTIEGKTEADNAYFEAVSGSSEKIKLLKEGEATVVAKIGTEVKAECALTIGKSSTLQIKDIYTDEQVLALKNKDKTADPKKFRGKVLAISSVYTNMDVVMYDGTGFMDLYLYTNNTEITAFEVGDSLEVNEVVTSYYGFRETNSITFTSGKSDKVTKIETTYADPTIEDMTITQFDAYYDLCKENGKSGATGISPLRYVRLPMVASYNATNSDYDYSVKGAKTPLLSTSKTRIDLPQANGEYVIEGFLMGANTSANKTYMLITKVDALEVKAFEMADTAISLFTNQTKQLEYTVTDPVGATGKDVKWEVLNEKDEGGVATTGVVSCENGLVTALKKGTAEVKLTIDGISHSVTVTVSGDVHPCTGLTVSPKEGTVGVGDKLTITATASAETLPCTDPITWETSDATIATVADGVVTGLKTGTVTITAHCSTFSDTATITVFDKHGTADNPLTVPEALEFMPSKSNSWYEGAPLYVKGLVVSVGSAKNGPIYYIAVAPIAKSIQCYSVAFAEGVGEAVVGDEIVVCGYIENYSGGAEIAAHNNILATVLSVTHKEYDVDFGTIEHANVTDVTGVTGGKAMSGSQITFKVTPESGYVVDTVMAGGKLLQPSDGVYTYTVGMENTFNISIFEESKAPVNKSYTLSASGTQYAENEVHKMDDLLTITSTQCHFTTELRIYSSSTHDGYAIFEAKREMIAIALECGNKADKLGVWSSPDGVEYTKVDDIETTEGYALSDFVYLPEGTMFIKLDVLGTQQVRIKSCMIKYAPAAE